ncbi:unnamed protein product [Meloidogyne enterolobii]|uniref:Uncharacterized protein n=1 Tax=Meloidogyne enterolobii TaxID=390850 RepID=A0ACB0Z4R9_MELEN
MSSINLFLVSIFILFQLIHTKDCSDHGVSCNDRKCCGSLSCKKTNVNGNYYCSYAPCVADGNTCQKDDGCCKGMDGKDFSV